MLLAVLGAGEIVLKRSLRLLPWDGATGCGVANCAGEAVLVEIGAGKFGREGLGLVGEAD